MDLCVFLWYNGNIVNNMNKSLNFFQFLFILGVMFYWTFKWVVKKIYKIIKKITTEP